ncbi:phosphotransferase [Natranaerobius trueperi]|nr:phosphotransferase [Natranaerobius trueperi]
MTKLQEMGAPVPKLIYSSKQIIITQYIEGPLLVNELFKHGHDILEADLLGDTLEKIYVELANIKTVVKPSQCAQKPQLQEGQMILGDMNLRNFILNREDVRIYRIDFESVGYGSLSQDLGKLCAFCITYDPPFTDEKIRLTKRLFNSLLDRFFMLKSEVKNEIFLELSQISKRRKIDLPSLVIKEINNW